MAAHKYADLEDTVYFWFGANDTSGSGADGESASADVRLAGAAADAAPVDYAPTVSLLSHANYPAGAYEVKIEATAENNFVANNTYAVFCTLLVDSENPTGFVGSFMLDKQQVDMREKGDADLGLTTQEKADAKTALEAEGGLLDWVRDVAEGDVKVEFNGENPATVTVYKKGTDTVLVSWYAYQPDGTTPVTEASHRIGLLLESPL